jgi:molybdopterin/thiamine biosynthesis adenylyltransferase
MKNVIVVGAGALGSHLVLLIRNMDISVRVIDFDRVEQKNVLSQFHAKGSVGKSKVAALQQSMNFLFGLKIETIPHKLVSNNARELLGKADLVIDCLDNGESREIVQKTVRDLSLPCLHGALAANGGFGRSVWDEKFVIDFGTLGAATCEDGEHLPFIALVSAYMARSVQHFISNGKKVGYEISPGGAFVT